jgi:hypothetical protein
MLAKNSQTIKKCSSGNIFPAQTDLKFECMETLKFYKIAVVALLLLNAGTLMFLWLNRPPNPQDAGPYQYLVRTTGMDEAQQASYRMLRDEHRTQLFAYRDQTRRLREALFGMLATRESVSPEVQMLADSIGALRVKEEHFTYAHFRQVRALCRPDQLPRFDTAIVEAVQGMGPPDRRQRGR